MDSVLPSKNKGDWEDYASLVDQLNKGGIKTQARVKQLLLKHLKQLIAYDRDRVNTELKSSYDGCQDEDDRERVERGVFFNHTGLIRTALDFDRGVFN